MYSESQLTAHSTAEHEYDAPLSGWDGGHLASSQDVDMRFEIDRASTEHHPAKTTTPPVEIRHDASVSTEACCVGPMSRQGVGAGPSPRWGATFSVALMVGEHYRGPTLHLYQVVYTMFAGQNSEALPVPRSRLGQDVVISRLQCIAAHEARSAYKRRESGGFPASCLGAERWKSGVRGDRRNAIHNLSRHGSQRAQSHAVPPL
ncbi:hypothetical protein F4861DRAFT_331692 [Xylaria intraflava]|nr:hypothetical protein F4861DRAFT_331692 [Xylaria intraflava]